MIPFARRAPTKKRHTKPCRFYQTSRCPLSAEECDFAHVYSNEALQSPKTCRYFSLGKCGNGPLCRYRHIAPNANGMESMGPIGIEADISRSDFRVKAAPTQKIQEGMKHGIGVDLRSNKAINTDAPAYKASKHSAPPQPTMYTSPPFAQWHHHAFSSPHVYVSAPSHQYTPDYASPTLSAETSSISTSNSTSSQNDDIVFVTEDPGYSEHLHQCQSRIRLAEEPMVHYGPRVYRYPASPPHLPALSLDTSYHTLVTIPSAYPSYPSYLSPTSPGTPSVKRRSRSSTRSKAAHYKTKPCKFYRKSRNCPNGDECTFIHEEATAQGDATMTAFSPVNESPVGLPQKPLSLVEENRKKNFYPISWRVIGGGVMMGDTRSTSTIAQPPADEAGPVEERSEGIVEAPNASGETLSSASTSSRMMRRRSSSSPPVPTHNRREADMPAESP